MVHIGAAVASTLTHFHCYLDSVLCCVTRRRTMFAPAEDAEEEGAAACVISQQGFNDADQREFVSAGTAAGLAAAFGCVDVPHSSCASTSAFLTMCVVIASRAAVHRCTRV